MAQLTRSYPPARWRLLLSQPADGPLNMAVDEAILQAVAAGEAPSTLRFYAWSPPCLSLGRAQDPADVDLVRLRDRGWDVVRRPTGGKAILHTDELTYSVITPLTDPRVAGGIVESYQRLSAALMRGLELIDLIPRNDHVVQKTSDSEAEPVCFIVPSNYEITLLGKKLIGSAQARQRGVVLQHGSLPLCGDLTRICEALAFADEASRESARDRVRARAITLEAGLGQVITWERAANAMKHGFREALNLEFQTDNLTAQESAAADELRAGKYARLSGPGSQA
jgi:lipoate-protein ligase A